MMFRQKTQKIVIVFFLTIAIAPIAFAAISYLHSVENAIQDHMQSLRVALTRASNRKHVLNDYAMRLSRDTSLYAAANQYVEFQEQGQWQTPFQRARLRIIDSFDRDILNRHEITSASLDWLDSDDSNVPIEQDFRQIMLSANVRSVSHAIEFIASIKNMAKPYPLIAEGCGYKRSEDFLGVKFQCLLTLITWELPMVTAQIKGERSSSTQAAYPAAHSTTHSTAHSSPYPIAPPLNHMINQWRLFNLEKSNPNFTNVELREVSTDSEHSKGSVKGLVDKRTKALLPKTNPSKGFITGPAGTLILNAITK